MAEKDGFTTNHPALTGGSDGAEHIPAWPQRWPSSGDSMKLFGFEIRRAAETPVHPDNRASTFAWFNRQFLPDGDYTPQEGENSSVVAANVNWLTRALVTVPLRMYSGDRELDRHPVLDLIRRPNLNHTYRNFLYGIIRSLVVAGDANVELLEPGGLQVMPYQWLRENLPLRQGDLPRYFMHSYTDYRDIPEERVIKILWQPYDRNQTLGESPLVPLRPELMLDRAAMEGAVGRLGAPIPGVVLSPKETDSHPPTAQEKEALQTEAEKMRGYKAGQMMVVEGRFDATELTGQLQRFDYEKFHDLVESRVSAVLGIFPRVVHLGAGLHQSQGIGSTMDEEIRLSWQNGAQPMGDMITEGLTHHLLPKLGFPDLELRYDWNALNFETEEQKQTRTERLLLLLENELITKEYFAAELGIELAVV